jgi:GT2 family glycosyltransferase
MLDEIGLFDPRFFAYLEDVDLAWRAQRAGWRCLYAPEARVLHHTSATAGAGSAFKQRLIGRNKIWLAAKNARAADLPLIMLYDGLGVLYAAMRRGNLHHLVGRLEGLRHVVAMRQRSGGWPRGLALPAPPWPWRVATRQPV